MKFTTWCGGLVHVLHFELVFCSETAETAENLLYVKRNHSYD